ncbi:glycolipid transfer protein domain-containing protein [Mucor mucedo]|uniref:glycolipid transfer protein domain-containing protein n=1 Tax=Mucor mucedo TaxID=29922 RepID=UPI00222054AD|nr:glycolipid transfer protein domain-containing protein [Mucor mucedo]KAI7893052.1 glycolipid transfer protein domain-containing protein [Mucor mucedo]
MYTDVETTHGINTDQFLKATDHMLNMFDLFGSTAFSVVQNDMRNNVKKIRTRYLTDTKGNNTLENLMANEAHQKKRLATEAVVWLKRGLDFTARSLMHSLDHPAEELATSFRMAYDATLRPYHSFILAMNACPWRKDFYERIGIQDESSIAQMREWLTALLRIIAQLDAHFEQHPAYLLH